MAQDVVWLVTDHLEIRFGEFRELTLTSCSDLSNQCRSFEREKIAAILHLT
jgi:hypothetical protein